MISRDKWNDLSGAFSVGKYASDLTASDLDKKITPWVQAVNDLQDVCTVWSCCGHVEENGWVSSPYLTFLIPAKHINIFAKMAVDNIGCRVTIDMPHNRAGADWCKVSVYGDGYRAKELTTARRRLYRFLRRFIVVMQYESNKGE